MLPLSVRTPVAGLNKYSSQITQPKSQGASQAMLYATGGPSRYREQTNVLCVCVWQRRTAARPPPSHTHTLCCGKTPLLVQQPHTQLPAAVHSTASR
jgi:hypothetical protein